MTGRAAPHPPSAPARRLVLVLTVTTAVLAAAAIACSIAAIGFQRHLADASRYNATFDLSQTGVELMRMEIALHDAAEGRTAPAVLRYEILKGRIAMLAEVMQPTDGEQGWLIGELRAAVLGISGAIEPGGSPQAVHAAVDRLTPFVAPVLRLASSMHARAGDEVQQNQRYLAAFFWIICAVTLLLSVVGASLILLVGRQNRDLGRIGLLDALTGLANRLAFNRKLAETGSRERAMLLVDLDHFKTLNDTLGHTAGDRTLVDLAARLRRAASDAGIIARIGGDEFAILFSGADALARGEACCERILSAMRDPVVFEGREIRASVTLGLASAAQSEEPSSLLNDADIALYAAKASGRGRYMVFRPEMKRDFLHRQRLLEDLDGAVGRGEMFLLYQPIVSLSDRRTRGFEALLRWRHPEFGLVAPDLFVPIAEASGMIGTIGAWVMEEACRQASLWPSDVFVTVNVSTRQLKAGFSDHVSCCLSRYPGVRGRLIAEITETALIDNDSEAEGVLQALKALGCRIALDDFGTGYASLAYLRRFAFDKIKIDRSFLMEGEGERESLAIIAMICALADRLELEIVAEGIEGEHHCQLLHAAGCDLGQGYLFSRPLSPADCDARLLGERAPPAIIDLGRAVA